MRQGVKISEVAVPRQMFANILAVVARLRAPPVDGDLPLPKPVRSATMPAITGIWRIPVDSPVGSAMATRQTSANVLNIISNSEIGRSNLEFYPGDAGLALTNYSSIRDISLARDPPDLSKCSGIFGKFREEPRQLFDRLAVAPRSAMKASLFAHRACYGGTFT
jgi:hypothetical protein